MTGKDEAGDSKKLDMSIDVLLKNLGNDCSIMGFIRLPILVKLLGVSKTTIYKEIREGRFPKQVRISPRVSAWRISDIKAHLEQLTNERAK